MPPSIELVPRLGAAWSRAVLYADRGVIVLNKPPGLVCQSSRTEVSCFLLTESIKTDTFQDNNEAVDDFSALLNGKSFSVSIGNRRFTNLCRYEGTIRLASESLSSTPFGQSNAYVACTWKVLSIFDRQLQAHLHLLERTDLRETCVASLKREWWKKLTWH